MLIALIAQTLFFLPFSFFCVKILDDDAAQELMPVVAGAVFTLTAHLSQSVKTEQKQSLSLPMVEQSQYVLMLDGSFTSSPGSESISMGSASIGDSSLHIILKKLLDFILKTGGLIFPGHVWEFQLQRVEGLTELLPATALRIFITVN